MTQVNDLVSLLETRGIRRLAENELLPSQLWQIESSHWGNAARLAREAGWRWSAGWAEDLGDTLRVNSLLEKAGNYVVLRTEISPQTPELPSQTPHFLAADRCERHTQDLFGIRFLDHPDPRRWTRHQAWSGDEHPLRKGFPLAGKPPEQTPPDKDYPFVKAQGASIHEIPVGPVHAGIIEPGHFRFQAVGETVLNLEEHLGYVHKGIEKRGEGRDPEGLARLAGRVSGDTTVGHAWAACLAMERAAGIAIPDRAASLRAIMAERERIANHLGDLGAICNDVGYAFAHYQFGRLRENWLRDNRRIFGHRLLMDRIVPGGVAVDLDREAVEQLDTALNRLGRELDDLLAILDRNTTLGDRLYTTGVLTPKTASILGCLGYVGRSSGQTLDVRRDAPYPPYDQLKVKVPVEEVGDVGSRFWIRYKEIRVAMRLLRVLLGRLPGGEIRNDFHDGPADGAEGLGIVEGWRGEIVTYIRFGENGLIDRYFPRDPSWLNWPALERIVLENIVPDFPVCNKSVNGSYAGVDL